MSFNCQERDTVNSEGRRMFLVCRHHSIGFGIVFDDDRASRAWNCVLEQVRTRPTDSIQVNSHKFRWDIRKGNLPLIYE